MDTVDPHVRSRMMSAVRRTDTKIELKVRRSLHALGFRYRKDVAGLPGRPDIALRKYGAVVFVHGCFWHGHDCRLFRLPSTRTDFWKSKITANRRRDEAAVQCLRSLGWRVAIVWECAVRGASEEQIARIARSMANWLTSSNDHFQLRGD
jgi:DNA mismatch endonuclease (patch repair protein)